jgi:hypothetical protein
VAWEMPPYFCPGLVFDENFVFYSDVVVAGSVCMFIAMPIYINYLILAFELAPRWLQGKGLSAAVVSLFFVARWLALLPIVINLPTKESILHTVSGIFAVIAASCLLGVSACIFEVLLCFYLCLITSIYRGYWFFQHLKQLGTDFQGLCPSKLVWAATYSPLKSFFLSFTTPILSQIVHVFRWLPFENLKFSLWWMRGYLWDVEQSVGDEIQSQESFALSDRRVLGKKHLVVRLASRMRVLLRSGLASVRAGSIPRVLNRVWGPLGDSRETMYENDEEIGLLEDFDD